MGRQRTVRTKRSASKPTDDSVLSDKEAAFIREYAWDWNRTAAAIRAGYSAKSARTIAQRLLQLDHIQRAVYLIQSHRARENKVDVDWSVDQFKECYKEAMEQGNVMAATKALTELCKIMGFYEKHNKQKILSAADAEALRERLKEKGMDLSKMDRLLLPSSN